MIRFELYIHLKSDVSPGSGDSVAGLVDHEITHENGIPIIPAKRIKGALRGVAKELVDWGGTNEKAVNQLFGQAGQQFASGFKIYDAKLCAIPEKYFARKEDIDNKQCSHHDEFSLKNKCCISNYESFLEQLKSYRETDLLALFTMLYTKTATEDGQAQTGTLRTIQVINKGLVFKSIIDLENADHKLLLEQCVKGLRRIGYGRTRGLGEIECKLKSAPASVQAITNSGKRAFRITLQQPALLAGNKGLYYSCTQFVPGSALLGVFASLYIKKHQLGQDAHKHPEFARLFLRGGVSFGYAYPEVNHHRYMPCPAHIQWIKNTDKAMFENQKTEEAVLRKIGAFVHIEEDKLRLHEPEQQFRMHHSRPADRQYGRALNDTPNAIVQGDEGQFYYYTSLSAGQSFVGELKGEQQDIDMLVSLLKEVNHTIHLGRSRTAEYGAAKVEMIDQLPKFNMEQAQTGDRQAVIYLATPLTLQNEHGRYIADPSLLIKQFEREVGADLQVDKLYLKQTILTGYHAKWRLPKQERPALDAGTVLVVSTNKEVDWSLLERKQWGEENSQGCGEVLVLSNEKLPGILHCETVKMNLHTSKQVSQLDDQLTSILESIHKEIEVTKTTLKEKREALELAKSQVMLFEQYSNSQIYKLEQYCLQNGNFTLPKEFPDKLIKFGDKKLKENSQTFIQYFFHAIKLEVRKNG
ncbi:RAMP superfamily CRISPR-associated protein [Pseudogracilibacillus sp. SO30301A]|uniref:RAMP superfamily CRISPR-associated protein n=1 Tax=Pseudogracilibacillus sp. SO30301A TaxID=3098291 RepID=UPI00300E53A1